MLRLTVVLSFVLAGCAVHPVEVEARSDDSHQPVPVPGIPAAAADASAVLNGTVTLRPPGVLPSGAVVTVRVEDVSRADAPAMVVAEQTIRDTEAPVVFALPYDPRAVDVRHRYVVRATVRDAVGALLFTSTTATPVFTDGAPIDGAEVVVEAPR